MVEEQKLREKLAILEAEYKELKAQISDLTSQRSYNQILVQRLKKRKLVLKDQIAYIRERLCDDIVA